MIKRISEAKTLVKHISYDCKWKFNLRDETLNAADVSTNVTNAVQKNAISTMSINVTNTVSINFRK